MKLIIEGTPKEIIDMLQGDSSGHERAEEIVRQLEHYLIEKAKIHG